MGIEKSKDITNEKKVVEETTNQKRTSEKSIITQQPAAKKNKDTTTQTLEARKSNEIATQKPITESSKETATQKAVKEQLKESKTQKVESETKKETKIEKLTRCTYYIAKCVLLFLWIDSLVTMGSDTLPSLQSVSPGSLRTLDPTICHLDQNRGGLYFRGRMRNAWASGRRLSLCVHVSWEDSVTSSERLAWGWDEENHDREEIACDNPEIMATLARAGHNLTSRYFTFLEFLFLLLIIVDTIQKNCDMEANELDLQTPAR